MKYFFCRLIPPRPTFIQDVTEAEAAIMHQHVAYWKRLMETRQAVAFGPVADPKGGYGSGIIALENEADIEAIGKNDPSIKANRGFKFEVLRMLQLVTPS